MNKKLKFAKIILTLILCLSLSVLAVACGGDPEKFTVTFDSDGGTTIASQTVEKDETINLPTPEKQGFVFDGWYDGSSKMASPYVVKKDVTLKAKWTANQTYTVTFDTDGGSAISAQSVNANSSINLPTPTKQGYIFDGWYDGSSKMTSPYVVTQNVTLTAKWISATAETVDIFFDTDGGNTIVKQTVEKGSAVTLPTPTKAGYTFDGWYVGADKASQPYVATGTVTLVAHWKIANYTLTYNTNGGDVIASVTEQSDTVVTLPLPTKEGYAFDAWYNGNTKVTGQITLSSDVTLVAHWKDYNPSNDYNYYAAKYNITSEIKIVPINFSNLDEMLTIEGRWLVYIDSEDSGAASRFAYINNIANTWDVTIHHFNPDLAGGYASTNSNAHTTNILGTLDSVAQESKLSLVKERFHFITKNQTISDHSLLAINAQTLSAQFNSDSGNPEVVSKTRLVANVDYSQATSAIIAIATRKPSAQIGSLNSQDYITSVINTFNYYADDRWHMVDDAFTAEKQDVYQTVANYAQLSHLLDNNQGIFAVLIGGAWCPNTTAIAKLTNDLAKDYGISTIYNFDTRFEGGIRVETLSADSTSITVTLDATYLASTLNTRAGDATGSNYNFNYLYATFMSNYLPDFVPKWAHGNGIQNELTITSNGQPGTYARMYAPTVLLFDGSGTGKARLVDFVDAEYMWADISAENSAVAQAWTQAVKDLFDKNTYAAYHPIEHDDAVEITPENITVQVAV